MRKLLFFSSLLAATAAHSAVTVSDVRLVPTKGGWRVSLRATDKTKYTLHRWPEPDRLIIDVPDAVLSGNPQVKDAAAGSAPTLRYSQFTKNPNVVRVVVNLPAGVGTWREDSFAPAQNIVISLPMGSKPTAPTSVAKAPAKRARPSVAAAPQPVVISARDLERRLKTSSKAEGRRGRSADVPTPRIPHSRVDDRSTVASRDGFSEGATLASVSNLPGALPAIVPEEPVVPAWTPEEAIGLINSGECPTELRKRLVDVVSDPAIQNSRYVWGAQNPGAFDCSGLALYVYDALGVKLPRVSTQQSEFGELVDRSELRAGDLVFFITHGGTRVSHVGIYLGDGQFLHAANPRRNLQITRLDDPYYATRFACARRVFDTGSDAPDRTLAGG